MIVIGRGSDYARADIHIESSSGEIYDRRSRDANFRNNVGIIATIIAITEFGRTARINGTNGSDHGTGTVAFLAGGAVAGGRVVANWPGLKANQLYQGRDLAPTTDLRALLKGVLADQLGISAGALGEKVFPESAGVAPMQGLAQA